MLLPLRPQKILFCFWCMVWQLISLINWTACRWCGEVSEWQYFKVTLKSIQWTLVPGPNSCWIELSAIKATAGLCSLPAACLFEFIASVFSLGISWLVSVSVGNLCLLGVSPYSGICSVDSRRAISVIFECEKLLRFYSSD